MQIIEMICQCNEKSSNLIFPNNIKCANCNYKKSLALIKKFQLVWLIDYIISLLINYSSVRNQSLNQIHCLHYYHADVIIGERSGIEKEST